MLDCSFTVASQMDLTQRRRESTAHQTQTESSATSNSLLSSGCFHYFIILYFGFDLLLLFVFTVKHFVTLSNKLLLSKMLVLLRWL